MEANESEVTEKQTIDRFIDKWKGFLKGSNPDDAKFKYLSEKYK